MPHYGVLLPWGSETIDECRAQEHCVELLAHCAVDRAQHDLPVLANPTTELEVFHAILGKAGSLRYHAPPLRVIVAMTSASHVGALRTTQAALVGWFPHLARALWVIYVHAFGDAFQTAARRTGSLAGAWDHCPTWSPSTGLPFLVLTPDTPAALIEAGARKAWQGQKERLPDSGRGPDAPPSSPVSSSRRRR